MISSSQEIINLYFFVFLCYLTAPPSRSLSRRLETAERVKKGLGLAVSLILRSVSEDSAGKGHSDSVVPPAGDECVFGVGFILLLRLAARCRGGSRRRRELRKVWDLACGIVQATKNRSPPPLTVARFGVLLSQVSSSLAPGLSPFGSRAFRLLLRLRLGALVFFV